MRGNRSYLFVLRPWAAALLAQLLFWGAAPLANAASITNVVPVNVTPNSFSILWRTVSSTPAIAVFADAQGATNLAGQLGIEAFPLNTGNPDAATSYDRRQSLAALRQKTEGFGLMLMRVTGCQPGTKYYYQVTSTPSGLPPIIYPASGPLPSVTTEKENTFAIDDQFLIIDVSGLDTYGHIVTLSNANAGYRLAAVVGDGVGTNQVAFNINDLFMLGGGGNFAALGAQQFTADLIGTTSQSDTLAQFTVNFGSTFNTAFLSHNSFGSEFLVLSLASCVLQTGQGTNVTVTLNSSAAVSDLSFFVDMPAGHLTNFSLQGLTAELDPALSTVTSQGTTGYLVHFVARSGQTLSGNKPIAQLAFNAVAGQHSAFVPLQLRQVTALKPDTTQVSKLVALSGRAVVVGVEALMEATTQPDGSRGLMLYGKPLSSYAVEYATDLKAPVSWTRMPYYIPLTNLALPVQGIGGTQGQVFYRAVEFFANPPILQAGMRPDGSRQLTIFGRPGSTYYLQYANSLPTLSSPVPWNPLQNVTLTNSFGFLTVADTGAALVVYRIAPAPIGRPILGIVLLPNGMADLTLSGNPGSSYAVQYATSLVIPINWTTLVRIPLDSSITTIHGVAGGAFYRAIEFQADPPIVEALLNPDQTRTLLLYGVPGRQYSVHYNTNVSNVATWQPVVNVNLSKSFAYQGVTNAGRSVFYRLQRN